MKNLGGNFLLWIVIIIVSVSVLQYASIAPKSIEISYAEFTDVYKDQYENISSVTIEDKFLFGGTIDYYEEIGGSYLNLINPKYILNCCGVTIRRGINLNKENTIKIN